MRPNKKRLPKEPFDWMRSDPAAAIKARHGLDFLEDVSLSAFALDFFAGAAEFLELGVIHTEHRAIDVAASLALTGRNETVESILEKILGHCFIPFGRVI
jgi:hypothetical protein